MAKIKVLHGRFLHDAGVLPGDPKRANETRLRLPQERVSEPVTMQQSTASMTSLLHDSPQC